MPKIYFRHETGRLFPVLLLADLICACTVPLVFYKYLSFGLNCLTELFSLYFPCSRDLDSSHRWFLGWGLVLQCPTSLCHMCSQVSKNQDLEAAAAVLHLCIRTSRLCLLCTIRFFVLQFIYVLLFVVRFCFVLSLSFLFVKISTLVFFLSLFFPTNLILAKWLLSLVINLTTFHCLNMLAHTRFLL